MLVTASWGMGVADSDTFARQDQRDNYNIITTWTRMLRPNLINEFKANYAAEPVFVHPSFGGNWPEKLGFPSIIPQTMFPGVSIAGVLTIGRRPDLRVRRACAEYRAGRGQRELDSRQAQHQGRLRSAMDPAELGELRRPSGWFDFNSGLTGDPQRPAGTGVGMATYLLGEVSGGELRVRRSSPSTRGRMAATSGTISS